MAYKRDETREGLLETEGEERNEILIFRSISLDRSLKNLFLAVDLRNGYNGLKRVEIIRDTNDGSLVNKGDFLYWSLSFSLFLSLSFLIQSR